MRKMMNLPLLLNEILFFLRLLQKTLHILMHGLSHGLAVCHGLDHRTCALDGVAASENAGDAGAADLIRFKQAASVGFQILGAVGDRRTGPWLMETITLSAG